jgi:hypothetical protein
MTTSVATWLPVATARAAVLPAAPARTAPSGRHRAPDVPGPFTFATPQDIVRRGRHAERQWSRELHDPARDEADPLSWLGFADAH